MCTDTKIRFLPESRAKWIGLGAEWIYEVAGVADAYLSQGFDPLTNQSVPPPFGIILWTSILDRIFLKAHLAPKYPNFEEEYGKSICSA